MPAGGRRPPPPPPPVDDDDGSSPPPLPSRSGRERTPTVSATPPRPPVTRPPGPAPEDEYEPMRGPDVVNLTTKRKKGSVLPPFPMGGHPEMNKPRPSLPTNAHAGGAQAKPPRMPLRVWESFRELGNKLQTKERKISSPESPVSQLLLTQTDSRHRRTTLQGTHLSADPQDDTYEEPSLNTLQPELPPRPAPSSTFRPFPNHDRNEPDTVDSDSDWEEEWDDDEPYPPVPPAPQEPEDCYEVAEGGNISNGNSTDDVYEDPDGSKLFSEEGKFPSSSVGKKEKPAITLRSTPLPKPNNLSLNKSPPEDTKKTFTNGGPKNSAISEMAKRFESRQTESTPKPTLPTKPKKPTVPNTPSKPGHLASSESDTPSLPPRPNKSLPEVPRLPPNHPVADRDSKSDDNNSAGSTSSGSDGRVSGQIKSPGPFLSNQSKVAVFPVSVMHEVNKKATINKVLPTLPAKPNKKDNPNPMPKPAQHSTEEIYDDGCSEELTQFSWFHGQLPREEGIKKVEKLDESGTFLIRESKQDGASSSHPYTLVVYSEEKAYSLKIRLRNDNRYAIGNEKPDEVSFENVPELVRHHRENNIKLSGGGAVKLTKTPRK